MAKLNLGSYPHLLGFEQLERLLERAAKSGNEGYPPFNIEQTSASSYRITLAVAGFREEDLSITLEDRQLARSQTVLPTRECRSPSGSTSEPPCSGSPASSGWPRLTPPIPSTTRSGSGREQR